MAIKLYTLLISGYDGLPAEGARILRPKPNVDAVPVEAMPARQATEDVPDLVVLLADLTLHLGVVLVPPRGHAGVPGQRGKRVDLLRAGDGPPLLLHVAHALPQPQQGVVRHFAGGLVDFDVYVLQLQGSNNLMLLGRKCVDVYALHRLLPEGIKSLLPSITLLPQGIKFLPLGITLLPQGIKLLLQGIKSLIKFLPPGITLLQQGIKLLPQSIKLFSKVRVRHGGLFNEFF